MYAHRLIRVHGDEAWEEWGSAWWKHADAITDLWFFQNDGHSAERPETHPTRNLDWGAVLKEVSRADLLRLTETRPLPENLDGWRRERQLLADLPDARYGVIWIEDTEPQVGPGQRFDAKPDAPIGPILPD